MMFFPLSLLLSFFILAILGREFGSKKICALCVSVSATWLVLLYNHWVYGAGDPVLIGILLGGSAVGGMYYFFSKTSTTYQIFKFPALISFFWIAYQLITGLPQGNLNEILFLLGVWAVFIVIFILYENQKWQNVGKKMIECCKNW
ncbi:MAG: hypothetical protein AAB691_00295 [Patescibacteria group bacterium]